MKDYDYIELDKSLMLDFYFGRSQMHMESSGVNAEIISSAEAGRVAEDKGELEYFIKKYGKGVHLHVQYLVERSPDKEDVYRYKSFSPRLDVGEVVRLEPSGLYALVTSIRVVTIDKVHYWCYTVQRCTEDGSIMKCCKEHCEPAYTSCLEGDFKTCPNFK